MAGEGQTPPQKSLDLTTPIQNFTELVLRSAHTIGLWKDGMKVSVEPSLIAY